MPYWRARELFQQTPSWLSSAVFHLTLLLVLAVWTLPRIAPDDGPTLTSALLPLEPPPEVEREPLEAPDAPGEDPFDRPGPIGEQDFGLLSGIGPISEIIRKIGGGVNDVGGRRREGGARVHQPGVNVGPKTACGGKGRKRP